MTVRISPRCRSAAAATVLIALCCGSLQARQALRFREASADFGLSFRHHHGGSGTRYMVETMVGGVVVLDYDGDGDEDVLWIDGAALPGYEGEPARTVLHRNDGGRFVDVTAEAGLEFSGYGCGAAAGDIDGDGDEDVLVTAFGRDALFVNRGDGTFVEEGARRGIDAAGSSWSSSAAFADIDLDGDLDLYVGGYVDFTLATHKECGKPEEGIVGYCHPDAYEGEQDRVYRNRGDGTFEEVAAAVGLEAAREASLGVVFTDLDDDLFPDLYIANDLDPNQLYRNLGDGTFEDLSLLSGTGYGLAGTPEAGMGVSVADFDGDGLFDLFVTNFALESNALYSNRGAGVFIDSRFPARVAEPSLQYLGFGVAAADFDHDGDQDLVIANGHILDNAELLSTVKQYAQRNQVMANEGGTFSEARDTGLDEVRVSRGLALGDLDADLDPDVVIVNSNQVSEVYENVGASPERAIVVDLRYGGGNPRAVGARLVLRTAAARQLRTVLTGASYLSQSSLDVHFGTGGSEVRSLLIRWPEPTGPSLRIEQPPTGRRLLVERR